jgi:replicative DNA helicase
MARPRARKPERGAGFRIVLPNDTLLDALKVPPHSLEAEQSVLGGLLLDNAAADKIGDILSSEDFYNDAHRSLYGAMMTLIADNKPADVITVAEALGSVKKLEYVGGMAYLGALVENAARPTSAATRRSSANAPSCAA